MAQAPVRHFFGKSNALRSCSDSSRSSRHWQSDCALTERRVKSAEENDALPCVDHVDLVPAQVKRVLNLKLSIIVA